MTSEPDSLDGYREACSGQPYRALVELHAVRHDADSLAAQIRATRGTLPPEARRGADRLYNAWNRKGQREEFLELDCTEALDRLVEDARRQWEKDPDDASLKRAFRIVTLGLALTASLFPDARHRMGIRTAAELGAGPAADEG